MKVFTAEQMRAFDKAATEEYGIPSIVLMENAALRVVEFLEAKFSPLSEKKIVVLCGKGNNGGDGLAIARHLFNRCRVACYATDPDDFKRDAQVNSVPLMEWHRRRTRPWLKNVIIQPISELKGLHFYDQPADIILDCLLGTGATAQKPDDSDNLWKGIWSFQEGRGDSITRYISVDIPTGISSDDGSRNFGSWPRMDFTITFAAPKRGFFVRDGLHTTGEIWLGDIGTLPHQMEETETGVQTLDLKTAKRILPRRLPDAHKGDAGRALVVGGSFGMSGAVALASKAVLKSGAGLCIAAIPEKILPSFASSILEATSHALPDDKSGHLTEKAADKLPELWEGVQVLALGPGLGRSTGAQKFARRVILECPQPLIIDADGLFALAEMAPEVKNRPADTILTPHPGEMGTLMGISAREVNDDRFGIVKACAEKYGAWVVLKGARSLVASPKGEIWVNLTGNAGMATGGSGDALTGTIAGLLAQTKHAGSATKLGVYLHGLAGDICFRTKGNGLVAGDIVEALPLALEELKTREVERINGRLRKLE